MNPDRRCPVAAILLVALTAQLTQGWQASQNIQVGPLGPNRVVVETNQILNPAGTRVSVSWKRINDVVANPNGDLIALVSPLSVGFYQPSGTILSTANLSQNAAMKGAAFSPDGSTLAVSTTGSCGIALLDVATATQRSCLNIVGGWGPTGLVFDLTGNYLYVTLNKTNGVAKVEIASGKVVFTASTGVAPLGIAMTPDGAQVFVSNMGGSLTAAAQTANSGGTSTLVDPDGIASSGSVSVFDTSELQFLAEIPTGLHPGGIAVNPDGSIVAVANANSDTISLVDVWRLQVTATIAVPTIPSGMPGSSPTDVAFSKDGQRLYATLGGINAVAAFDINGGNYQLRGTAPTDWFPVAIATTRSISDDDLLFVANSKGTGRVEGTSYSAQNFTGTMNVLAGSSIGNITTAAAIDASNPFGTSPVVLPLNSLSDIPTDLHSLGVQHVFLIIKENRTYDQVLGDVSTANGVPDFAIYGQHVTPNLHNLATGFVVLDNYYASGTVSADGHQWITQAMATDYAERQNSAGWPRSYPFAGDDPLIFAPTGFIWGNALRHGLTVRVFGEFTQQAAEYSGTWTDYVRASVGGTPKFDTPSISSIAAMNSLHDHSYPAFNITVSDTYRARLILDQIAKWDADGSAPNLVIIQLPADHTLGTMPGAPTPQAMIADGDVATGRIVEAISHSSLWATSAVFATEDDAQDGADHVDGHRTTCFLASPFVRRGAVDSTYYNHTSLVRTIEELLGLPAMNRFDATALPMRNSFTMTPDTTQYDAVPSDIPLDQMNPPLSALKGAARKAAKESLAMNFRIPDAAPEKKLNRILWQQAKGWGAKYPKPPHRKTCPKDADD